MALGKDEREVCWCMLVCLAGRRLMYKQNVFRTPNFVPGCQLVKKYVVTSFILAYMFVCIL